ncbi:MAG: efflux RND transporter periplasmic adaptor subunit [Betaproteobacteria bacterium HGW-Betaproteobacteria-8]|nr:MAG: efflux RND transporter periplasmic adaptor subunit [Betaproteobacteria bacterium HGW-Betaproteobacteria-8]
MNNKSALPQSSYSGRLFSAPTFLRYSSLLVIAASLLWFVTAQLQAAEAAKTGTPQLRTLVVGSSQQAAARRYDGTVEAIRQTMIAAQVPGTIVELNAAAGDQVKSGQLLVRLDAREASQGAVAADALLAASQAQLNLARQEYERQQQLYAKNYISEAALEQAQAKFKSAQAQVNSQVAQAGIAKTQKSFNVVQAPYSGVISELLAEVGDIALPGKALMTLYDPTELRVNASIPQSLAAAMDGNANVSIQIEIPGLASPAIIQPVRTQLLPSADPSTHTRTLRLTLPADLQGVSPGMFARVSLQAVAMEQDGAGRILVPASAVVRRAEMTGLYVLNAAGKPLLRQIRLGGPDGDQVEVLSGVSSGERIALDPQIAASVH